MEMLGVVAIDTTERMRLSNSGGIHDFKFDN
jgi:hypothetical protein